MRHIKLLSVATFSILLAGCASTFENNNIAQNCINIDRKMISFEKIDNNTLRLNYLGNQSFDVTVSDNCPIHRADKISFSQGPQRLLDHRGDIIYAGNLHTSQICGRAMDNLIVRDKFQNLDHPGYTCRIEGIQRVQK